MTDVLPDLALMNLPAYPMPRPAGCPLDLAPCLAYLRAQAPLVRVRLWDGSSPWLVTRHAQQRALLADPRVSADPAQPGFPHISERHRDTGTRLRTFLTMDDPEHARLRRMVAGSFTVRRIETLRSAVKRIVDDRIDALLAGPKPADLVPALALPVPSLVICQLLGVPYADHDFFEECSRKLITLSTSTEAARQVQDVVLRYLDQLITRKLADPGDDLLSRLATERVRTGEMTQRELVAMASLMVSAGHETTANMIALGTLALLRHPAQLAALRQTDDPALVAGAVEELLRYLSIVHNGRRRVALADIEIAGQVIHAGEGLIIANEIANRDEAAFSDPDALDIHRDARGHLAFGFGGHQCVGQTLARLELQVVYGTLYRRIPTLALAADLDSIPFKHDGVLYGVYKLPVTW